MVNKSRGFTIVELLIVIVVIGILAAIVIVAFNGVQSRAKYATMKSDIASFEKIIKLYYIDEGSYPPPDSATPAGPNTLNFATIPGIVPKYASRVPAFPSGSIGYYAYIRSSDGQNYKIVRLVNSDQTLPSVEQSDASPDLTRPNRGWGVWSPSGSGL